jgi:hypothetical protein
MSSSRYFIVVYGSQHDLGAIHRPKLAHTYARFTEEIGVEIVRDLVISWLPRDGQINPLGRPEPGKNYSLDETVAWLDRAGSSNRWSSNKTEIEPRLFESAIERVGELSRGSIQYVMADNPFSRPHRASNCIHAVSDLAAALERLGTARTGILHGNDASRFVYHYFWPFYINPQPPSSEEEQRFETMHRAQLETAIALSADEGP